MRDHQTPSPQSHLASQSAKLWPAQTLETVLKEMIDVATGEYEGYDETLDPWTADNRADIDRWQCIISDARATAREAFKAGWKVNAVGNDVHPQEYLDGCEEVDWEEFLKTLSPSPQPREVGSLWDQLVVLSGYHITRPPTPDHEFVQVCNGDLRKMVELMDQPVPHEKTAGRWRAFEDTTPGYWGIELEDAGNDDDAIMCPQKIHRDTVARIVEAHNAALSPSPQPNVRAGDRVLVREFPGYPAQAGTIAAIEYKIALDNADGDQVHPMGADMLTCSREDFEPTAPPAPQPRESGHDPLREPHDRLPC